MLLFRFLGEGEFVGRGVELGGEDYFQRFALLQVEIAVEAIEFSTEVVAVLRLAL
jgi:hypothetical protein